MGSNGRLVIEILLDFDEMKIIILDNAGGMDRDTLENSIRLNNEKPGNSLNLFGVGLKNSAF